MYKQTLEYSLKKTSYAPADYDGVRYTARESRYIAYVRVLQYPEVKFEINWNPEVSHEPLLYGLHIRTLNAQR